MEHVLWLSKAISALLIAVSLDLAGHPAGTTGASISADPFRSILLHGGGEVLVRHASSQRVTLVTGRRECTSITVEDGQLRIEGPYGRCHGEHELTIEVQTPEIDKLTVSDGGLLRCVGAFPSQQELITMVDNGGRIDIRSMRAQVVRAAVDQGGGIFTRPEDRLFATIEQG